MFADRVLHRAHRLTRVHARRGVRVEVVGGLTEHVQDASVAREVDPELAVDRGDAVDRLAPADLRDLSGAGHAWTAERVEVGGIESECRPVRSDVAQRNVLRCAGGRTRQRPIQAREHPWLRRTGDGRERQ